MQHFPSTDAWDTFDVIANMVFTVVFVMEMLLKVFGLGVRQYWFNNWNKFDAVIVVLSIVDIVVSATGRTTIGINFTLLRVFRVARIVKLVKKDKGLLSLFQTVLASLPSLANVGSLLGLLFFMYAIVGMNLYSDVARDDEHLMKYNNFETFGMSMITLFRCLTGESWNLVMHALSDAGATSAVVFFLSFTVIGNFMMLNLFVAVILESFGDFMEGGVPAAEQRHQVAELSDSIRTFKKFWMNIDEEARMFIPSFMLVPLLYALPEPMGFKGSTDPIHQPHVDDHEAQSVHRHFILDHVQHLRIKVDSLGRIFYLDVLIAILHHAVELTHIDMAEDLDNATLDELNLAINSSVPKKMRKKMSSHALSDTSPDLDLSEEFNSATAMQMLWRGKQSRIEFFRDTKERGLWTPRLQHLFEVTIPGMHASAAEIAGRGTAKTRESSLAGRSFKGLMKEWGRLPEGWSIPGLSPRSPGGGKTGFGASSSPSKSGGSPAASAGRGQESSAAEAAAAGESAASPPSPDGVDTVVLKKQKRPVPVVGAEKREEGAPSSADGSSDATAGEGEA